MPPPRSLKDGPMVCGRFDAAACVVVGRVVAVCMQGFSRVFPFDVHVALGCGVEGDLVAGSGGVG